MNIRCIESFCPQKTTECCYLIVHSSTVAILTTENGSLNMCICYLDWHEACTMLLPSGTHKKRIISVTAVLLPFVTYLLHRPCAGSVEKVSELFFIIFFGHACNWVSHIAFKVHPSCIDASLPTWLPLLETDLVRPFQDRA
jgi:hypothetical protein